MAISELGLPGTWAAFCMDQPEAKSPQAPATAAVLVGWQRSMAPLFSSFLGM